MAIYPRVIYKITHNVSKRMYIGSTGIPLKRRISLHLNALRAGRHTIEDFQSDFDKYGEDFTVEIIGEMKITDSINKEYECMKDCRSYIRGVGYNYKDNHANFDKGGVTKCILT